MYSEKRISHSQNVKYLFMCFIHKSWALTLLIILPFLVSIKTLDNLKKIIKNNSLVSFQVANVFCTVGISLGVSSWAILTLKLLQEL